MKTTARQQSLMRCHDCGKLQRIMQQRDSNPVQFCPRCGSHLHMRIPGSVNKTWALVITSLLLYIPANVLPIMTVKQLGVGEPHTIVGGIIELIHSELYPIALIVFVASILVPLLKIIGIILLLLSIHFHWQLGKRERVMLFHMIEFVGRWSMLDIFMIALLTALVSLGQVAEIEAGAGATAFAAVVVLTIVAAKAFDTRLIWDDDIESNN